MTAQLGQREDATAGNLAYEGAWHSHPAGHVCTRKEFRPVPVRLAR
jgi:hypothetical protein